MGRCVEDGECLKSLEGVDKNQFKLELDVHPVWALMNHDDFKSGAWELFGSSKGLLEFVFGGGMKAVISVGEDFPQITAANVDDFTREMLIIEESGLQEVVLDLNGVATVNSMAIGAIFAAYEKFRDEDRKLHIINASESVKDALEVCGIDQLLE